MTDEITPEAARVGLTIFLLKPDQLDTFKAKVLGINAIPLLAPFDGVFLPIISSEGRNPDWVPEVSLIVNGNLPDMKAKSPGGLLTIHRETRTFVVTFGHAWQKVKEEWTEADFGRRVALNAMNPTDIVEVRSEQIFAKWHLNNERAPRAAALREFALRLDRDMLNVIEGTPSNSTSFGQQLRGGTNLHIRAPLPAINDLLDLAFDLYVSDAYKSSWPDIDNIAPVKSSELRTQLDAALDAEFANGVAEKNVVLFTPSQRKGEFVDVESYVYGKMTTHPAKSPYLLVGGWLNFLKKQGKQPSVATARETPVHLLDEHSDRIKQWTVYDCLGYELAFNGKQYVLSSGTWYEPVAQFVSRINKIIGQIETPKLKLPDWDDKQDEGEYNLFCAEKLSLLHFDVKKIFYGGGHSQFEFCDLLDMESRRLLFAKIPSKSSGMSHLLEQVRRTAELLFSTDPGYREKLMEVFKTYHPKAKRAWLKDRPRNGTWEFCLVSLGRSAAKLPLFAKIGLTRLFKELNEAGHPMTFIDV